MLGQGRGQQIQDYGIIIIAEMYKIISKIAELKKNLKNRIRPHCFTWTNNTLLRKGKLRYHILEDNVNSDSYLDVT